jgi:hypothetical protein
MPDAIDDTRLAQVLGGSSISDRPWSGRPGYAIGYGLGWGVTRAVALFDQSKAFSQVGAPWLRERGLHNIADGAAQSVRDVAARYQHGVDERGEIP